MGIVTPLFALSGAGVDGRAADRVSWTPGPYANAVVGEARNKDRLITFLSIKDGARAAATWPPEIFLEEDERF